MHILVLNKTNALKIYMSDVSISVVLLMYTYIGLLNNLPPL